MMLKTTKHIIFFILCLLAACGLQAQQTKEQLASYYYQHGEYAQAAEIYERLYSETSNKFYYQMLFKSYLELDRTRDAERLVERRIKNNRRDIYLHVDMAAVWLKQDNKRKAEKEYEEALSLITPDLQQTAELVQALENAGRHDLMIRAYKRVREVSNNPYLFINEVAALYGSVGDYEAMTQEYLDFLDNQPNMKGSIQISLQRAMLQTSDERLNEGLRNALMQRIDQQPDNQLYLEMMIWYSLQVKDFDFAMTQAQAVFARFPSMGAEQLYKVAGIALANNDYDVAQECYATIIERGNSTPNYYESRIGLLQTKFSRLNRNFPVATRELEGLRAEYDNTLAEMGKGRNTLVIMRSYASLLAYYIGDIQAAADILYDALELNGVPQKELCQVKLELGDLLLFAGEPWEASLLYMQVERNFKEDVLGAEAKLRNARLAYYNHDFRWAVSQLSVLRSSTTKLIANDAMELSLLISDNMEDDSTYGMLEHYATADLYLYRNLLDSAWTELEEITRHSLSHPILDEVMMQKAKIRMRQQRYDDADSLLTKLFDLYGDDLLGDDALMLRAELNEQRLHRPEVAKECYEKILTDFPVSLYCDMARKRYNELRDL